MPNLKTDLDIDKNIKTVKVGENATNLWIDDNSVYYGKELEEISNPKEIVNKQHLDNAMGSYLTEEHFVVFDVARWYLSSANVFYSGYPGYYSKSTNVNASLSGTADTFVYGYLSTYCRTLPFTCYISNIQGACRMATGSSTTLQIDFWKINAMANSGSITTQTPIDHIATMEFTDPTDPSYQFASVKLTTIDDTAKQFTAGENLFITGKRTGGTDGSYWYSQIAIGFTKGSPS